MTTLREDAQQALDALVSQFDGRADAIDILSAALAEPPQQPVEPVAWMVYTLDGKSVCVTDNPADFTDEHRVLPLYTAPPQRLPLTEEEMESMWEADTTSAEDCQSLYYFKLVARVVEQAHGIKE